MKQYGKILYYDTRTNNPIVCSSDNGLPLYDDVAKLKITIIASNVFPTNPYFSALCYVPRVIGAGMGDNWASHLETWALRATFEKVSDYKSVFNIWCGKDTMNGAEFRLYANVCSMSSCKATHGLECEVKAENISNGQSITGSFVSSFERRHYSTTTDHGLKIITGANANFIRIEPINQ